MTRLMASVPPLLSVKRRRGLPGTRPDDRTPRSKPFRAPRGGFCHFMGLCPSDPVAGCRQNCLTSARAGPSECDSATGVPRGRRACDLQLHECALKRSGTLLSGRRAVRVPSMTRQPRYRDLPTRASPWARPRPGRAIASSGRARCACKSGQALEVDRHDGMHTRDTPRPLDSNSRWPTCSYLGALGQRWTAGAQDGATRSR